MRRDDKPSSWSNSKEEISQQLGENFLKVWVPFGNALSHISWKSKRRPEGGNARVSPVRTLKDTFSLKYSGWAMLTPVDRISFKTIPFLKCGSLEKWRGRWHHFSRCQVSASLWSSLPRYPQEGCYSHRLEGHLFCIPSYPPLLRWTHPDTGEESSRSPLHGQECLFPRERANGGGSEGLGWKVEEERWSSVFF